MQPLLQGQYGIEHLWLFGSVARGEALAGSDVDLLYQPSVPLGLELMTLWDELETAFGRKVDLGDVRYVKPQLKEAIAVDLLDVF
jgi:predicted nucleotidyltransferase